MGEITFVVEDAVEGGYAARALGHSIFTQAESIDELQANVHGAVACHFDDDAIPRTVRLLFVRVAGIQA